MTEERIVARLRITFDQENSLYGRELLEIVEDTSSDETLHNRLKEQLDIKIHLNDIKDHVEVGKVFITTIEKSQQF